MKIKDIELKHISIPLTKTFKTALRTVDSAENTVVMVHTDDGRTGFGEAPPTKAITGEDNESIRKTIKEFITPALIGQEVTDMDAVQEKLHGCIEGNNSAKAAVDMALYDLFTQEKGISLCEYLGGYRDKVETDITISINEPDEMAADAAAAVKQGFSALKLKVGIDSEKDIQRVRAIREAVGKDMKIRLDANQGWEVDEAIRTILKMEELGFDIELVEQPVKARDFEGMKKVKDSVNTVIMADESCFTPEDARRLLEMNAADVLNIKLMKCGGIYNALKIIEIAEEFGVECMLGCMVESKISLTAAAHLAAAKKTITRVDLDAAILLKEDPVIGGFHKDIPWFSVDKTPGLGITGVNGLQDI
ncbi:MAG: dipeptide epimerase [Firmicutes bacterium]|nr:dipeptide epimerase [Bacillota bacterium]